MVGAGHLCQLGGHPGCDLVRVVMQQGGQRPDLDRPAAPLGDAAHVERERAAGDDADGARSCGQGGGGGRGQGGGSGRGQGGDGGRGQGGDGGRGQGGGGGRGPGGGGGRELRGGGRRL